jgi:hypothetical protein
VLDSPDTALVIVTGFIPPGTRRGDLFDVQVTLPPGSKVSSLRGGYLQQCHLRLWDTKLHVNPNYQKPDGALAGQVVAKASGQLLIGLGGESDGEQDPNQLVGAIWEGAQCFLDRPYYFMLKDQRKQARYADAVAQRINTTFQDDPQKRLQLLQMKGLLVLDEVKNTINAQHGESLVGSRDMARAANKEMVVVNVPWEYRHNTERYILVVCKMPLGEKPEKRQPYRECLRTMLHDPAHALKAALRLEALGKESIPVLRAALDDSQPMVRFAAAEALAYLGDGSGIPELARLATQQDYHCFPLRGYCLIALATLEQSASRTRLMELLSCPVVETRYGAFRALQLLNVASAAIEGEQIGRAGRLHRLAPHSPGLVHYALSRRPEVVLFGEAPTLVPPFALRAGKEFNVTAAADDQLCTVSRYQIDPVRQTHEQCALRLEEVLRTLAALGAEYPDVVALLHEVQDRQCVNCPIYADAMPQTMPYKDLTKAVLDAPPTSTAPGATAGEARPPVAAGHYLSGVPGH